MDSNMRSLICSFNYLYFINKNRMTILRLSVKVKKETSDNPMMAGLVRRAIIPWLSKEDGCLHHGLHSPTRSLWLH